MNASISVIIDLPDPDEPSSPFVPSTLFLLKPLEKL